MGEVARLNPRTGNRALLGEAPLVTAAEHLNHKKVIMAVAIDVGKIHAHRRVAELPEGQRRNLAKVSGAIVDPAAILGEAVVGNEQIRGVIAVHVAENHAQALVAVRPGERLAGVCPETAIGPVQQRKPAVSVVQVKLIRLAVFKHLVVDELDPVRVRAADGKRSVGPHDVEFPAVLEHRLGTVVGDVQVEVVVAIDVGEGD